MKEQLITFETAKLAKEKGFDIGVNQSYIIYKESYNYDDDPNHRESYKVNDIEINSHYHVNNYKGIDLSNELYEAYSAPTQSLLQRWLREVHKIDVFCDCIGSGKYYSVIYDNNIKEGNDKVFEQEKETSYEEALEVGLQESLKLITNKE
tara:strand:+ start:143 stop:592 length:450 start_codon:yes stop_codon:yes gene_type:complete